MITIRIEAEYCKGCGLCIHYCPKGVLQASDTPNSKGYRIVEVQSLENCIACRNCEINCPDFAIYVEEEDVLSSVGSDRGHANAGNSDK